LDWRPRNDGGRGITIFAPYGVVATLALPSRRPDRAGADRLRASVLSREGFVRQKGLGEREIGAMQVGPWSVRLAEFRLVEPEAEGRAGYTKIFALALCPACDAVKAAYLRAGKPRNIRTAGALFSGTPYRQTAEIRIPETAGADDILWLTLEGWDGALHQATIPIRDASPVTSAWLARRRS
jgi:hypothetical protein